MGRNHAFVKRGFRIINLAVDADRAGQMKKALEYYKLGIHLMTMGTNDTATGAYSRSSLDAKIYKYTRRAREIYAALCCEQGSFYCESEDSTDECSCEDDTWSYSYDSYPYYQQPLPQPPPRPLPMAMTQQYPQNPIIYRSQPPPRPNIVMIERTPPAPIVVVERDPPDPIVKIDQPKPIIYRHRPLFQHESVSESYNRLMHNTASLLKHHGSDSLRRIAPEPIEDVNEIEELEDVRDLAHSKSNLKAVKLLQRHEVYGAKPSSLSRPRSMATILNRRGSIDRKPYGASSAI